MALGVMALARRDWMWSLTGLGNSFRGQSSERSGSWQVGDAIDGIAAIVAGAALVSLPLGQRS